MASNRTFKFGKKLGTPDFSKTAPFKKGELEAKSPVDDPKIKWHELADHHLYNPYLVEVTSLDVATGDLQFVFIDAHTGRPLVGGRTHNVNKNNWPLLYAAMPSTIPDQAQFNADQRIAFLMLNPLEMSGDMKTDASLSNTGATEEGKWPGSSAADRVTIKGLQDTISQLLPLVPHGKISDEDRARFGRQTQEI